MSSEDRKTVLVVDDEPEVRKLVCTMVTQAGYNVLTAARGDRALAVYKKHKAPIGLLITDVVAPGLSGPMLAERLVALQPDLKVLYISGYDSTLVVQKFVVEKGYALLAKPFTAAALKSKMRELLQPKLQIAKR